MRKAIPLGVVDYETLKNQNYFFIIKTKEIVISFKLNIEHALTKDCKTTKQKGTIKS